jgi:16S rRNA G1207 methylase RsmC
MERKRTNKALKAKSVRLGWSSKTEQKPQQLATVVGNGIKVESGMFSHSKADNGSKWLIP